MLVHRSSARFRRARAGVAMLLLAAVTVACGSDPVEKAAPATTPDSDSAFPFTVDHKFGSTEITAPPEKIIAVDTQWIDVLIALDHPPSAYPVDHFANTQYPWRGDALDDSATLDASDGIDYEAIRAQQPDLIVGTWAIEDETIYGLLNDIAPTTPSFSGRQVENWEDLATLTGRILDREDDAAKLIEDTHAAVAAVADELPGLDGKTFVMANYVAGDGITVVADPEDGASSLFGQLGMTITSTITDNPDAAEGRVTISTELIEQLDADVLLLLTNGTNVADIPGYDSLPAVRSGADIELDYLDATALNTPSPLSILYMLEQLRPALEAAEG